MRDGDLADDFKVLGLKLVGVIAALEDPLAKASGSDAASLARTRRLMGGVAASDQVGELERDYELLGKALGLSSGSGAAAIAVERRMLRKALNSLRAPEGVTKVAELASFRAARAASAGATSRRRKSR